MRKQHAATILESLRYSKQRIEDYPHADREHKQMNLKPILEAIEYIKKIKSK